MVRGRNQPLDCWEWVLLKFDGSGAPVWNDCIYAQTIAPLPGGGVETAGTAMYTSATVGGQKYEVVDDDDGLLARYDSNGNWMSTACTPEAGRQLFGNVVADPSGMIFLTGLFQTEMKLPDGLTLAPVPGARWTSFVAKLSP
jgi:hypothetical protein